MFYQRINATSCLMLCLMLCTACVPHQPYAAHRLAQLPQQFWVKHPNWSAQGTVLVKQLNHKESVYFNWEHQAQQDSLTVLNGFGITLAQLKWAPHHLAQLTLGEHTWTGASPEQLLAQQLGWSLPFADLTAAVLGHTQNPAIKQVSRAYFNNLPLPAAYRYQDAHTRLHIRITDWSFPPNHG